jgi:hypothetical protein
MMPAVGHDDNLMSSGGFTGQDGYYYDTDAESYDQAFSSPASRYSQAVEYGQRLQAKLKSKAKKEGEEEGKEEEENKLQVLHWSNPDAVVGAPRGSADGVFPFDRRLKDYSTLELMVARSKETTALKLIDQFDLSICKVSFDGKSFRIPSPHLTFNAASTMDARRAALIRDFMAVVEDSSSNGEDVFDQSVNLCSGVLELIPPKRWRDVGLAPYDKHSDVDGHVIYLMKLIDRLQKYDARGIKIIDLPEGALEFDTVYPWMCGM